MKDIFAGWEQADATASPSQYDWSGGVLGQYGGGGPTNPDPMAQAGPMAAFNAWLKDSGFLSSTENNVTTQGWGGMAIGGLSALGNLWMGKQQLDMAKDSLSENKRQFNLNYNAQKQSTNTYLADRQAARIRSSGNSGAYQSVGDYMKENGVV